MASIDLLARFSLFNPSFCECREENKKDGNVSEEAHGSWGSLITVMAERETEDERHERWSASDMAGISLQRWDESTYSAASALLLMWGCAITSSSRPRTEGLRVGEAGASWSEGRGSECITLWQTHMDCALNYCQSSSSQRPRIPHEDNWKCLDSTGKVRPGVDINRYKITYQKG